MSKAESLKQKIKDNKGKIITGLAVVASIGGLSFVVYKQNDRIQVLEKDNEILKNVMSGAVLPNLKESTKRQLRYAEGRLANGIKDGVMSEADKKLREEEITLLSEGLENIFKAEEILSKSRKRD